MASSPCTTEEKGEVSSHPGRPSRQKPKARSTTPTGPPSKRPRIRRPPLKKVCMCTCICTITLAMIPTSVELPCST